MALLSEPLDRFRGVIEGAYPSTPVTGRSVPAGTFAASTYRGDPSDLGWTGLGWHRHYQLTVKGSGALPGDPPNVHAGQMRLAVLVELSMGYTVSPDAKTTTAQACATVDDATALAHSDWETIFQALAFPGFWGGTSPAIVGLTSVDGARTSIVIPRRRIVCTSTWRLILSYAPGTVWP